MSKFVWSLMSLALIGVTGVDAQEKKDEKKQPRARQQGQRPNIGNLLQFPSQRGGGQLISDKEKEELKLDDKQKDKLASIQKDYEAKQKENQEASAKAFQDLRAGGDRTKIQEAMTKAREVSTKAREDAEGKLTAVLNADQKKKFEELKKARPARGGFGNLQPGAFGRGGSTPGQILSQGMKDRLELNDEQKKKVEELEKKVKDELNKILTDDQKKKLEQGSGRPGTGRPGQAQPGNRPARPRPDQN